LREFKINEKHQNLASSKIFERIASVVLNNLSRLDLKNISNGEDIYFSVAFKPPATILMDQKTSNLSGDEIVLKAKGRHDPCVVPRAIPIVESMAALVLLDLLYSQVSKTNYNTKNI
jgi:chorismate synthase